METLDQVSNKIGSFFTKLNTDTRLYQKVVDLRESPEYEHLDRGEQR